MLPRTHLIRLQRALYDRLKVGSRESLGELSPELQKYLREYQRDFATYEKPTTKRELLMEVLASQIVFCGDYHTLSQAQRTVIRILRETVKVLKRKKKTLVLALEMLSEQDLPYVQKFLAGRLSERGLLQKTEFRKRWGFAWENYRELFYFAREERLRVMALSQNRKKTSLKARDAFAAKVLCDMTEEDPDALVFTLIGDLHLATNHLPGKLKAELRGRRLERGVLVIHQNHEEYYWDLVEQGMENFVEVIKVKPRIYCVMNTTPWVKLQSHLKWLETVSEVTIGTSALSDFGKALDLLDHSHEVVSILSILKEFFEITEPIPDGFYINGPLDLSFLERIAQKKTLTQKEQRILSHSIKEFDSQFFPRENILFLTNLSLNHLAAQSAYFIHSYLSGFQGVFERPNRDFYTFLWIEALAFLSSKVMNPKRQCLGFYDLKRKLREFRKSGEGKSSQAKATQFAFIHLEKERKISARQGRKLSIRVPQQVVSMDSLMAYYKAAKILGALLGQALYSALLENRVEKDEVRALFYCPFTPPHNPKKTYLQWTQRLEPYQFRDVVKREKM